MLGPEGVTPLLKGGCFCEAATYSIYGPPLLSAYCHCTNCQRLTGNVDLVTGCPFVHTIHFKETDFAWSWQHMQPSDLDYYENPLKPYKRRFRCKQCGVPVASFNTRTQQYSVWGASLERGLDGELLGWEQVKPTAHQFYGTRMLDVNDELGKWEGYEGESARIG
ncbi:Mss4-like protein [Boletus edulis BED1]|uniref:Mss4-like protein n=1 Tax=Boletus edulis BED1 TaxID=1328754 RepID=A0AAD4BSF3_BOLED|nr:Mss4-like protein [Boletus edulis BED1]